MAGFSLDDFAHQWLTPPAGPEAPLTPGAGWHTAATVCATCFWLRCKKLHASGKLDPSVWQEETKPFQPTNHRPEPQAGKLKGTVPPSTLRSQDNSHGGSLQVLLRGLICLSMFSNVFLAQLGRAGRQGAAERSLVSLFAAFRELQAPLKSLSQSLPSETRQQQTPDGTDIWVYSLVCRSSLF